MIKKFFTIAMFFVLIQSLFGQSKLTIQDSISIYFEEIKSATNENQAIWNKDLYGPILLVNPNTRKIYTNVADSQGILRKAGRIFTGILPADYNIANTAVNLGGRNLAMIMLPLPGNKQDRINLLAHELFHVSQPSLGFRLFNTENNHLDQKDGRTYLRLELEALKKAILSTNDISKKLHLTNALIFRKYRHLLYRGADTTENLLELNEGMAEYTGFIISSRNQQQSKEYLVKSIKSLLNNPTFVRSFAYQTIPVYGYLLSKTKRDWNKEISISTDLTDYFIRQLNLTLPNDLKKTTALILSQYDGKIIIAEEESREENTKRLIAAYKSKFIEQPHFEIVLEQMQVAFDPGNIKPIEDKGTVYPNMRITDNWGILTVTNGALMSPGWDKISVTIPLKVEERNIAGDGWTLELKDGFAVVKEEKTGNYKLIKK